MIRWFEKHNKISLGITILIAIIIFYLSSLTFEQSSQQTNTNSILYHFFAFFSFAFFLLILSVKGKEKHLIFFLSILISILYGISDEFHQFFVQGRYCSFSDVLVNTTGILFASMIYLVSVKYRKKFIYPKMTMNYET